MGTFGLATDLIDLRDMRDERLAINFPQPCLERFVG